MQFEDFANFVTGATRSSGRIIREYWEKNQIQIDEKEDASPVTEADRKTEQHLRQLIAQAFPSHGILAEEFGNQNIDAEYVWVLDPIDGTKSFISHVPLFGTLIGLLHRGQPVFGAIHQPILNQLCIGSEEWTFLNEKRVTVRPNPSLSETRVMTSAFETLLKTPKEKGWNALVEKAKFTRTWGDCYGYLLLASGQIDVMIDPIVSPWDILPIIPIIKGAGGTITTWEGNDPVKGESSVAASTALHPEIIELLNQ